MKKGKKLNADGKRKQERRDNERKKMSFQMYGKKVRTESLKEKERKEE